MASGEGAEHTCFSPSLLCLEALLPPEEAERAGGDMNPELMRLRDHLQEWLSQYEPVILWVQRLLVWERPLHSIFVAFMLNTAFWLLSSTTVRPLFLLSVSLLGLVLLERWKHKFPTISVSLPEVTMAERESGAIHPRLLSIPELSLHLAESCHTCCLHLQEMIQYKRQNHGKFCGLACAGSLVLAVVGHYVPGVMISYIILLSVLLWPLVVYNELIQKMYTGLEPILMKLDYSMKGGTQHHKHDKKNVTDVIVWGNVSGSFHIDLQRAKVFQCESAIWGPPGFSLPVSEMIHDRNWLETDFLSFVGSQRTTMTSKTQRTAALSAANGIIAILKAWDADSTPGEAYSLCVLSAGQFAIPAGLVFSMPVCFQSGSWAVLPDVTISEDLQSSLQAAADQLRAEKNISSGQS